MQNALALKKRVGVPLVAVVKNDAYGHGLVRVANVLRDVVDGFAVATVDEALKIADMGVETMILLPCLTEAELTVASKRGFVVTLSDFPSLSLAERCGSPLAVQIKVDSGMSRLGFSAKQLPAAVGRIAANKNFDVRGVFSHFLGSRQSRLRQTTCRVFALRRLLAASGRAHRDKAYGKHQRGTARRKVSP